MQTTDGEKKAAPAEHRGCYQAFPARVNVSVRFIDYRNDKEACSQDDWNTSYIHSFN